MRHSRGAAAFVWVSATFTIVGLPLALAAPPDGGLDRSPRGAPAGANASRSALTREELPGPRLAEEIELPCGSRADLLLWKQALDAQNELSVLRSQAEALLRRFHRERHDARLAERIAAAPVSERRGLTEVRRRLGFGWKNVRELIAAPWPLDPRLGCRMQFHDLEGAMAPTASSMTPGALAEARLALRGCLKVLTQVVGPLRPATHALAAAFADADRALELGSARAPSTPEEVPR